MKLSVGTNFDNELITKLKRYPVYELFGKLHNDIVGGGRPSYNYERTSFQQLNNHVEECHNQGIEFNYLLNASCMNNYEFTRKGQKRIDNILHKLSKIGVDSITVSIPYLAEIIKKRYPNFKVKASAHASITNLHKAKNWEELGVDCITLDPLPLNRQFRLLKEIRSNIKCDIQLIANIGCVFGCPYFPYHAVCVSHASQKKHKTNGFMLDYCMYSCTLALIKNPEEFIKSPWIRPEDIKYYEDIGIEKFKILERGLPNSSILERVEAYSERSYNSNLLDLLRYGAYKSELKRITNNKKSLLNRFRYFFRPFSVNVFKLIKLKHLMDNEPNFYLDNKRLDGFIQYFLKDDCLYKNCENCGYCSNIAKEVITFDNSKQVKIVEQFEDLLGELVTGKIYKYI